MEKLGDEKIGDRENRHRKSIDLAMVAQQVTISCHYIMLN